MPEYREVYRHHADRYDELVRAEDSEGNLGKTLGELVTLAGARVVEAGAGTGRVTRVLLAAGAAHVVATDVEPAMLEVARASLAGDAERVQFEVADARALPVDAAVADLAIAGWVFGHFRHWSPDDWRNWTGAAVSELERVVRPGGRVVIIETLGTGAVTPAPPSEALGEYYAWLESERGFTRLEIRTDYRFSSVEEASRVTGLFFGPAFAARVRAEQWAVVPECTGVWSRVVSPSRTTPA